MRIKLDQVGQAWSTKDRGGGGEASGARRLHKGTRAERVWRRVTRTLSP